MITKPGVWIGVIATGTFVTGAVVVSTLQLAQAASTSSGTAAAASTKSTPPGQDKKTASPSPTDTPKRPLTVSANPASISNLVPGQSVSVTLTVGNDNNQDVTLTSVSASIVNPTPTPVVGLGCSAPDDFQVLLSSTTPVDLPKNSFKTFPATVRMNNSTSRNQDGCKSKTFSFIYSATATSK